jgi:hypothetical protein
MCGPKVSSRSRHGAPDRNTQKMPSRILGPAAQGNGERHQRGFAGTITACAIKGADAAPLLMRVKTMTAGRSLTVVSIPKECATWIVWIGPRANGAGAVAGNLRSWFVIYGSTGKRLNWLQNGDDAELKQFLPGELPQLEVSTLGEGHEAMRPRRFRQAGPRGESDCTQR